MCFMEDPILPSRLRILARKQAGVLIYEGGVGQALIFCSQPHTFFFFFDSLIEIEFTFHAIHRVTCTALKHMPRVVQSQSNFTYFLFFNFYNVVLVSAIQCKPATITHVSPPWRASRPSPHPVLPLQVITGPDWVPCVTRSFSPAVHFTHAGAYL